MSNFRCEYCGAECFDAGRGRGYMTGCAHYPPDNLYLKTRPDDRDCMDRDPPPQHSTDGIYRYRWETQFGMHSVFFDVIGGIIQKNKASEMSPIKAFEGRPLNDLHTARAGSDWHFRGDSLYQFTSGRSHYPTTKGSR